MRLSGGPQKWHEVDPNDSALVREGPERGVIRISRHIDERPATRVRYGHRRFRRFDALRNCSTAGVTQIEENMQSIDFVDKFQPEAAQASVRRLKASITHQIATIVRRLADPEAQVVKHSDALQVAIEHAGILKSVDESHPP